MKCPDDIAPAIVELISTAVLRIRAAGWSGDAELCAIEADHVARMETDCSVQSPAVLPRHRPHITRTIPSPSIIIPGCSADGSGTDLASDCAAVTPLLRV